MKLIMLTCFVAFVSLATAQTTGPERGWLIMDGGGKLNIVKKRFIELAGGPDANFVLIPILD
jgi:hypothetical protein